MNNKQAVIFVGVLILVTAAFTGVRAQDKRMAINDKRITIQMAAKPLYTVFTRLINKYDISIGLEESVLDRSHRHYYFETNIATEKLMPVYAGDREFLPPTSRFEEHLITVNFKDTRLEDVMNSIVKQMQNYDWEISDEVVNIFPIRGRDPRLKKLLNLKVRDFGVGMGADVGSIQAQLMLFLPEFKAFLAENELEAETSRPGSIFEDRLLPDGMRFSDLTFRELLNAITKSKRGGWMLMIRKYESKPGKEFVEILI